MRSLKLKSITFITWLLLFVAATLTSKSFFKITATSAPDFDVFYYTAKDLILGKNPYINQHIFTGLGYPANTLLFYLPLTLLDKQTSLTVFTLISTISIIGCVYLGLKLNSDRVDKNMLVSITSLTLLSFPFRFTLGMGQNNTVSLLFLLLSLYFLRKKREDLSGIFLGIAVTFKTIYLFFYLYFVIKKHLKAVYISLIPVILSVTLVGIINDVSLYPYWLNNIIPPLFNLEGREIYYNQGISGFIARLTPVITQRKMLTSLSSIFLVILTSFRILKSKKQSLSISLFFITLNLIDSLAWQHHFIWLIFPFTAIFIEAKKMKKPPMIYLLGLAYFLIASNIKDPLTVQNSFLKLFVLSHVFWGTVILYWLNLSLLKNSHQ